MKKIKGLLFGIVSFLCFSSFGFCDFTYSQPFLDSSINGLKTFELFHYGSNWFFGIYQGQCFDSGPRLKFCSQFYDYRSVGISNSNYIRPFWSFGTSDGFKYASTGYNSNVFWSVGSSDTYGSLINSKYPLILNTSNGDYISFVNDSTIIHDGTDYHFNSPGALKMCFYGVGRSLSCVAGISGDYLLFNFSINNENSILYNTGVLVIPGHTPDGNTRTGNRTLLIALDSNSNLVYNIVESYSSDIFELKSSSIVSAGYIGHTPQEFFNKTYYNNAQQVPESNSGVSITTFFVDGYMLDYYPTIQGGGNPASYSFNIPCYRTGSILNTEDLSVGSVFDLIQGGGGDGSNYSGSISLDSCIDTQICWDSTGDNGEVYRICTNKCVSSGVIASGGYIGYNGTFYYVNSDYNVGNISNSDGILFDTGFLDEDGLLSIGYYSGLFNGQGFKFGVCPYPSSNMLGFVSKVNIGNFYPFMPLDCVFSAFLQGYKVHYFDDFGIFPDLTSQLISGDTDYHKTLFRFFDVCLCFGILFFCLSLYRLVKK